MIRGTVVAVFICQTAGESMQSVESVHALTGAGLEGDRYCVGKGSFSKGSTGHRQVTLINQQFVFESGFTYAESRRNIVTTDIELMRLIGEEFQIGTACMRGVKYCAPCTRPNKLAGKARSFKKEFSDRGGLIAEVIESGVVSVGCSIRARLEDY